MADFVLSCCSTADLTKEHFQQRDISYICFHYALDGVDYPDDLGETMPFDKFYAAMANGAETRTSQVNVAGVLWLISPRFSSRARTFCTSACPRGLSGAYELRRNTAARRAGRERYPAPAASTSWTPSARPRATAC